MHHLKMSCIFNNKQNKNDKIHYANIKGQDNLRCQQKFNIKMAVQKVKFDKTTTGIISTHLYLH